ncbi:cytochrome P450 [Penicillium angulare]|uniref:Cytochrome P450 n=1 Tax=Penicillium angulare TaxID=116970 RepID=A0A9W9F4R2_9EURO|nr:cytochrome P450 [Penicillium angulare]
MPERWLENNLDRNSEAQSAIPPSAWRPFERRPRACIGQELANLEMRVIIAVVAREYEFIKTGLGSYNWPSDDAR